MLLSDMNLKIRLETVGYNNKFLLSDGKFNLGKNEKVNLTRPPRSGDPPGPVTKAIKLIL